MQLVGTSLEVRERSGTDTQSPSQSSRIRAHSRVSAAVSQHPATGQSGSAPTIDLNPHSGDSVSSFLRHRSSSFTSKPLSSSDPTSETQQSPCASSAPSMFSGYLEYTSGRITSSSPEAHMRPMMIPSHQHTHGPTASDPISIPVPILSPPRTFARPTGRPSSAPPPHLHVYSYIPPSPTRSLQASSPPHDRSTAPAPSSSSSLNLTRSPQHANSHPMFYNFRDHDPPPIESSPVAKPTQAAPREWWPYGAPAPHSDSESLPRHRSAPIHPPKSSSPSPHTPDPERQPSAPIIFSPFDSPPHLTAATHELQVPPKLSAASQIAPLPLIPPQPLIPAAPASLSAATRSTARSSTAGVGDAGRRSMPSFQSISTDSTAARSFQAGPAAGPRHSARGSRSFTSARRSDVGMLRTQSGTLSARGSTQHRLPGRGASYGDPRASMTITEDGTGPLPSASQCMASWQSRLSMIDSTMHSQSVLTPSHRAAHHAPHAPHCDGTHSTPCDHEHSFQ